MSIKFKLLKLIPPAFNKSAAFELQVINYLWRQLKRSNIFKIACAIKSSAIKIMPRFSSNPFYRDSVEDVILYNFCEFDDSGIILKQFMIPH